MTQSECSSSCVMRALHQSKIFRRPDGYFPGIVCAEDISSSLAEIAVDKTLGHPRLQGDNKTAIRTS